MTDLSLLARLETLEARVARGETVTKFKRRNTDG